MTAVGSNSDARKRRQESVPADETVRVPAALVEALRKCVRNLSPHEDAKRHVIDAARAVVDAAERPDEGEPCNYGAHFAGCKHEIPDDMCPNCVTPWKCNEPHVPWPPAPLSSPRRTRDEGTEDEAEAAWQAWRDEAEDDVHTVELTSEAFIAGFRAARLAGEDDR